MSYLAAFLIITISTALATSATRYVDRFIPLESRKGHHEVGGAVFAQVGIMASVLLAFVFSQTWQDYGTAASSIDAEAAALRSISILSRSLPPQSAQVVHQAVKNYAAEVVQVEWRTMKERRSDPEAAQRFEELTTAIARASGPPVVRSEMLTLTSSAHLARATRLFQMDQAVPMIIWVMLTSLYMILIAFVILAGSEKRGHLLLVGMFTASAMIVITLVSLLDLPFQGSVALSSSAISAVLN